MKTLQYFITTTLLLFLLPVYDIAQTISHKTNGQNQAVQVSSIKNIYKFHWCESRVLKASKGNRIEPSKYLKKCYTKKYLALFQQEGGAFICDEDEIKKYKAGWLPRKYVVLRSDMDLLHTQYRKDGDIGIFEASIGNDKNSLQGKESNIRIVYIDKSQFKFVMPDGNEEEANSSWKPGGKNLKGIRMCGIVDRIDPLRNIFQDSINTEDFQTKISSQELIYNQGWNKTRVGQYKWGGRPSPETYFIKPYIAAQTKKIASQGAAFLCTQSWLAKDSSSAFPSKIVAFNRQDFDIALTNYKKTGSVAEIEILCGYTPGSLAQVENELYVFFLDKSNYQFEMPDGNELEYKDDLNWKPGISDSGKIGQMAVRNLALPTQGITHKRNIENLKSQFSYAKLKSSGFINTLPPVLKTIHNRLANAGMNFIEDSSSIKYRARSSTEDLAKVENGAFVVIKPKGSIPAPSAYLDSSYLATHVNKFKKEGAGFIVIKSWTEGGNPLNVTLPPRKFVGLRSEMDMVVAHYKSAGNDWTVLRDELGLGKVDLTTDEIYYIKIDGDDPRFSFEVPNGNEGGAIVGEWVPSGYTKGGTKEAALIGSQMITHNKSVLKLIDNFPNNWEKIK